MRDVQPVFMIPAEKETAVAEIARLEAMAAELKLRVVAAAEDARAEAGARDNGAWLASVTRADFPAGRAQGRLAEALDRRWTRVATGMADGLVSPAQATVVVQVLDDLPDHLDPELLAQAETEMVSLCADFRPSELRRLGRHLLELVAPEIAEAEEAKRLQNEEQRAREKTSLRTRLIGDGLARTTIVHPVLDRDRLLTYLESYTSPRKHQDAISGEEDRIPHHRLLGQAFGALLEHLDPAKLPAHGGDATTRDGHHRLGVAATASSAPAASSAANPSPPPRSAGWPAPPRSSPSSSAATARSSTSAAPAACSAPPNAKPCDSATNTAAPKAAPSPPPGARPTTSNPGPKAATPTSTTASSPATGTTTALHDPRYETTELLPNGDLRFHRRR